MTEPIQSFQERSLDAAQALWQHIPEFPIKIDAASLVNRCSLTRSALGYYLRKLILTNQVVKSSDYGHALYWKALGSSAEKFEEALHESDTFGLPKPEPVFTQATVRGIRWTAGRGHDEEEAALTRAQMEAENAARLWESGFRAERKDWGPPETWPRLSKPAES